MMRIPRLALAALAAAMATPAEAHRLRVFATVVDGALSGYGFFVGGGRPEGATVIVRDGAGDDRYRGVTDKEGRFTWHPETPMALTVIVDARDGHVAQTRIAADRFGDGSAATPVISDVNAGVGAADGASQTEGCVGVAPDRADLARLVDQAAERAVARQIAPLLESYEAAQGAIRLNDVVSGIACIVGLAGMGLWALSRRRREPTQTARQE